MRPSDKHAVQELFGKNTVIAVIDLPSNLSAFAKRLPNPHLFPADTLIDDHTMLPYHAPFLPADRLQLVREDMLGSNGPAIHMRAGIMASQVPQPRALHLCKFCVREDLAQYGDCYWHREHQAPGVLVCSKHSIALTDTDVLIRDRKTRYRFTTAASAYREASAPSTMAISAAIIGYFEFVHYIATSTGWLLEQNVQPQGLEFLQQRYLQALAGFGYATSGGRVRANDVCVDFRERYPAELLSLLGCELPAGQADNWLLGMLRKPDGIQQPIRHLVLMHFLGLSPQEFFGTGTELSSDEHGSDDIYQVNNEASVQKDTQKRTTASRWDPAWDGTLRDLWARTDISLDEKARRLGVDPLTVKRHASRLGLEFPQGMSQKGAFLSSTANDNRIAVEISVRDEKRELWLKVSAENEGWGVKKLRQVAPALYAWLYRHDRVWLASHLPAREPTAIQRARIDWQARDKTLCEAADLAVKRIRAKEGRPVRVTKTAIGREIGETALIQRNIDKLPLTQKLLDRESETHMEFAIRRLAWAVELSREQGTFPGRTDLITLAGVRRWTHDTGVLNLIDAM
jgi:hypothetical protein